MTGAPRLAWSQALDSLEPDRIVEQLRDDVVIRVAVHDEPMRGRDIARFLFGVLAEELESMSVTDEIVEGHRSVVMFETAVDGVTAQGLNVVETGDDGLVSDLTIFFRPLVALERVSSVIGARMEERFGPRPD
ncbi:MAG: hypothetical protein H0V57_06815 [Thermoleophilaceae bacterium]|nr:hypothetical protein [Thermoleophilaceae bacterium]